ncbi:39S ribosomal protein L20, mitochondrial [Copidosoma floridanum]|uniref:39S ribosomal protein L20, mitochondrial n=1 Tax=Copidosoma floridanum TaxID=29053 RepID=UPI0006C9620D|nr:39S ribosomal protein L20, mitochondrial [Copidosoma floridanum]
MVLKTLTLFSRSRGPDEFWRKRKIFRLSAHFRGRARHCFSNAVRAVHRSLQFSTKGRDPRREWIGMIWKNRIESGCNEHVTDFKMLKTGLRRCEIHLDNKSLAELVIWEPRTFKHLVKVACLRLKQEGLSILQNSEKLDIDREK